VVTDSVVTGKGNDSESSAKLLAAVIEKPIEILETAEEHKETVAVGGGGTKTK
jgi:hypothetical protein